MRVVTSVGIEILGSRAKLTLKIQAFEKCHTYNYQADTEHLADLRIACTNVLEILGQPLVTCETGIVTTLVTMSGRLVRFGDPDQGYFE
jgi:hypothetical protein